MIPPRNNSDQFKNYLKEKSENLEEDYMGRNYEKKYRSKSYIGSNGNRTIV